MHMLGGFVDSNATGHIAIIIAFLYQTVLMYIKLDLLIRLCEKEAPIKQKLILSVLCGGMAAVLIDFSRMGFIDFGVPVRMKPLLVSVPGIVITFVCALLCVWSLKLTPLRTLEITVYSYLYFQTVSSVGRIISSLIFAQTTETTDYFMYIQMYVMNFIVLSAIYRGMSYILTHKPHLLIIKSGSDTTPSTSIAFSVFQLCYVYFCASIIMVLVPDAFVANAISALLLAVFMALSILLINNRYAKAEIHSKETHIQSLFESMNQFNAVKHDFYNILQTYNGYLEVGDLEACKRYHRSLVEMTTQAGNLLDLSLRAVENPALIALFLNKNDQAEKTHVRLSIGIKCPLNELPIEDIDLCRILSCLLDNAIEAAADSMEKSAALTIDQNAELLHIITVTNSIDHPVDIPQMLAVGATSKIGHQGLGLANVQRIAAKYSHCGFEMTSTEREVTACIRLKRYRPLHNE